MTMAIRAAGNAKSFRSHLVHCAPFVGRHFLGVHCSLCSRIFLRLRRIENRVADFIGTSRAVANLSTGTRARTAALSEFPIRLGGPFLGQFFEKSFELADRAA